jgi:NAD(P)H-hydrate epimerase
MRMRVCTATQMTAIDRETIAAGTPGRELMERAGHALCDALDAGGWLPRDAPVAIVCGKGNNGGDGLVMARLLSEAGLAVRVLLLAPRDDLSEDARANCDRLPRSVTVTAGDRGRWPEQVRELTAGCGLVVDAVFGTGITPPLRAPYDALCRAIGDSAAPVVAVDVPSGVDGDDGSADPSAVTADATLTVGLPKLGLLLPPGRDHTGQLAVVDIGFADELCARHARDWHLPTLADARAMLPARPSDTYKTAVGSLLVLAGSAAYGGAPQLTALGALRAGVGMLHLGCVEALLDSLRTAVPEAIAHPLAGTPAGTLALPEDPLALASGMDAVALGPGLGDHPATDRGVVALATGSEQPLVVDADGLNAFARLGRAPAFASEHVVMTPHPGELARLLGSTPGEVVARRLELVPELAQRWQVVLLLKGSPTLIGLPDGSLWLNPSGDDALARGGAGDVLTGVIGALLAQGCPAADAARLGALVHGLAGEHAAAGRGRRGVLTREIAEAVATVLALLE